MNGTPEPPHKPKVGGIAARILASAYGADGKNELAKLLGRRGGLKRAAVITPERNREIGLQSAAKRWAGHVSKKRPKKGEPQS